MNQAASANFAASIELCAVLEVNLIDETTANSRN